LIGSGIYIGYKVGSYYGSQGIEVVQKKLELSEANLQKTVDLYKNSEANLDSIHRVYEKIRQDLSHGNVKMTTDADAVVTTTTDAVINTTSNAAVTTTTDVVIPNITNNLESLNNVKTFKIDSLMDYADGIASTQEFNAYRYTTDFADAFNDQMNSLIIGYDSDANRGTTNDPMYADHVDFIIDSLEEKQKLLKISLQKVQDSLKKHVEENSYSSCKDKTMEVTRCINPENSSADPTFTVKVIGDSDKVTHIEVSQETFRNNPAQNPAQANSKGNNFFSPMENGDLLTF
jgi:hypothetical protein